MSATITAQQAAARLGCSDSILRRLATRTGIGKKAGRDWRFTERDIARLEAARRPVGRPPAAGPGSYSGPAGMTSTSDGGP